jgi:tetratricopeptide (TPR) repeat protein
VKKSEKFLNEFFDKQKDEISFITLKKNAKIKLGSSEHVTNKEISVPIRVNSLISDIQNQNEYDGISIGNIIDGIIYVLGTDKEFMLKDEYLNILKDLKVNLIPYVIHCINQLDEKKLNDAVVYGRSLVNVIENEKTAFVYASSLERKAIECFDKDLPDAAKRFMSEAVKYFEKSLDYDDKFALSYYKLGFYYKNNQLYIKAKLFWEQQQEFDDDDLRIDEIRNEIEQLDVYVRYETGYNLILNSEPQKGLDILLPLAEAYSGWWNLLFFIGLGYRSLGEYEIAEKYFENVLKIEEGQMHAINELGLCKMCLEKYEEAKELFTMLHAMDPKNSETLCNKASANIYLGNKEEAKRDIERALKINPEDDIAIEIKRVLESLDKNLIKL